MFLYQEQSGFLFNSDSHFLYDFISNFKPKGRVLDVGCGCGIVGLLLKRDFSIDLTGIDPQKQNIFLSKKNAEVNSLEADFIEADFLNHTFVEKFDFIVSNPPYYHDGVSKSKNDSLSISRYNTHLPLTSFIKKSNQIIAPKGDLIFCYDAKQLQMILSVLSEFKFIVTDIRTLHGTAKKPSSLVMIHAKKSSKSLTKIHPPLIHFKDDIMSKECEDIYQKTRTYSIKCKIM